MHSLHEIDCGDPIQTDYLQLYTKFLLMVPLKTRGRTNDGSTNVAVFVRFDVADERFLTGVVTVLRDRIILHLSASLELRPVYSFTHSFMLSQTLFPHSHSTICPVTHSLIQSHHQPNHLPQLLFSLTLRLPD